jgi:hypothetical protein
LGTRSKRLVKNDSSTWWPRVFPKSDKAGAFGYIRNHWDALNMCVNNAQVPIDNNRVEALMERRAIRNGFQTSGSEIISSKVGYIVKRRAAKKQTGNN